MRHLITAARGQESWRRKVLPATPASNGDVRFESLDSQLAGHVQRALIEAERVYASEEDRLRSVLAGLARWCGSPLPEFSRALDALWQARR